MIDESTGGNEGQNATGNADQTHNSVLPQSNKSGSYREIADKYKRAAYAYFGILGERILDADSSCWKWFSKAFWSANFWTAAATFTIAIATIFYTRFAGNQWVEMTKATKATQDAAYAACVGAQISQRELLEVQRTNAISEAMAGTSTMQVAGEIDAEKSYINFNARLPQPGELMNGDSNFYVVYSSKNDGKSAANVLHITAKAILVANDEVLKPDEVLKNKDGKPVADLLQAAYVPAGDSYPGTPEIGRPITPLLQVSDSKGSIVTKNSEGVQKVFNDSAIIAVIGHMSYSDFAGTHEVRFCTGLAQMQAGTMRKGGSSANEKICAKYNQRRDHYTFMAKPAMASSQVPLPNITCTAPRN
jgi:hypothetical protein